MGVRQATRMYCATQGLQPTFCNNCKWSVTFKTCIKIKNLKNQAKWTYVNTGYDSGSLGEVLSIGMEIKEASGVLVQFHFLIWAVVTPLWSLCNNSSSYTLLVCRLFYLYSSKKVHYKKLLQSEVSQKEENKYRILMHMWGT